MLEYLFDRHDYYRCGLFAVDGKPSLEFCIVADPCATVHTIGLVHPGHEERNSGHRSNAAKCPLLTYSGRRCVNFAAMQSKRSLNDVLAYVSTRGRNP